MKIAIPSLRVVPFLTNLVESIAFHNVQIRFISLRQAKPKPIFRFGFCFVVEKFMTRFELRTTSKREKRLIIVFSDDRRIFATERQV